MSTEAKTLSLLFVFHESERTGATITLFRYVKWLSENKDFRLSFLLVKGGPLAEELGTIGNVIFYNDYWQNVKPSFIARVVNKMVRRQIIYKQINLLLSEKFDIIIANTLVNASVIVEIKQFLHAPIGWYIHEVTLAEKKIGKNYEAVIPLIDLWIANSKSTKDFLRERFGIPSEKCVINYPPVIVPDKIGEYPKVEKWKGKFVIGASGSATPRKGCDLFILLALSIKKKYPTQRFHFLWVGNTEYFSDDIKHDIEKSGLKDLIEFTGEVSDPFVFYRRFDVFVSTSKEESFGLACMETAAIGKPVVGFEGTSELEKTIVGCKGKLVPYMDIDAMAEVLWELSQSPEALGKMGDDSRHFASKYVGPQNYERWIDTINLLIEKNTLEMNSSRNYF